MRVTVRALIMILIFMGGILCKVWIYTQGESQRGQLASCAMLKQGQKKVGGAASSLSRLFKSKRRLEKYGTLLQGSPPHFSTDFNFLVKRYQPFKIKKLQSCELSAIRQPPRLLSFI